MALLGASRKVDGDGGYPVSWYALALVVALDKPPTLPWAGGRVYTSPTCEQSAGACWHLGVRPHVDLTRDSFGLAVTIQVSVR